MSLARNLMFGLLLAISGALAWLLLEPAFGQALALRLLIGACSLALVWRELTTSPVRNARLAALAAWLLLTAGLFLFDPAAIIWLAAQATLLWLLRSLYRHDSVFIAGADALLMVLAVGAATATAMHTHSLFLTLWSLFLVQALHLLLPGRPAASPPTTSDPFETAWRCADAALRRLSIR